MLKIWQIAKICHDANKSICEINGDNSQVEFNKAPSWQQNSAMKGVEFCLANPHAPASANHESWLAEKEADGWKYGPVKDADKKEHPCMVAYAELPKEQQMKDHVFKAVVSALAPFIGEEPVEEAQTADQNTVGSEGENTQSNEGVGLGDVSKGPSYGAAV